MAHAHKNASITASLWRFIRHRIVSFLLMGFMAYLGVQLFFGERGLLTYMVMQHEKERVLSEMEVATAERLQLEYKVKRMRPDSLDVDLMEEESKRLLGVSHPDERVILLKEDE